MGEDELKTIGLFALLFWIIQTFYFLFNWLYWWQVKEYRLDRIIAFLRTKDGVKSVYLVESLFKIIVWIVFLFFVSFGSHQLFIVDILDVLNYIVLLFIPFAFVVLIAKDILSKRFRRPFLTMRALFIGFVCLILFAFIIWFIHTTPFLIEGLILNEILITLSPFVGILLSYPLVTFLKQKRKKKH